ncbi:hypothetical protein EVX99_05805 [Citrobacter koseri]|nr:hypothetical protein EVX99_05805 [Citrobacter koseri]
MSRTLCLTTRSNVYAGWRLRLIRPTGCSLYCRPDKRQRHPACLYRKTETVGRISASAIRHVYTVKPRL